MPRPRSRLRAALGTHVTSEIRGWIVEGVLLPGERLIERDLAHRMGVSRSPVREALHKLKQEGLVSELSTGGAYVALRDANDIRETYEVRAALERRIAALAAPKMTDEEVHYLENLISQMEKAVADGDPVLPSTLDRAFHDNVAEIAGNKRLLEIYIALRDQIAVMIGLSWRHKRPQLERIIEDHRVLVRALATGDSEVAGRAFEDHVEEAGLRAAEEMEQQLEVMTAVPRRRRRQATIQLQETEANRRPLKDASVRRDARS